MDGLLRKFNGYGLAFKHPFFKLPTLIYPWIIVTKIEFCWTRYNSSVFVKSVTTSSLRFVRIVGGRVDCQAVVESVVVVAVVRQGRWFGEIIIAAETNKLSVLVLFDAVFPVSENRSKILLIKMNLAIILKNIKNYFNLKDNWSNWVNRVPTVAKEIRMECEGRNWLG